MAASMLRKISPIFRQISRFESPLSKCPPYRMSQTVPTWIVEHQRKSDLNREREELDPNDYTDVDVPLDYRKIYPEFMPSENKYHSRDRVLLKLERKDMMRRRAILDIPEFYVGSIMAITVSDPYAPGKTNRFVGLCIDRGGAGLRAFFILRNSLEGEGMEIMYHMYNPTIRQIQVLKLEKRLDEQLYYLRDAPIEYSTIPWDHPLVPHPRGALVPVNEVKVPLNPRPWRERWERRHYMSGFTYDPDWLNQKVRSKIHLEDRPWEKRDLMKNYRAEGNDQMKEDIYKDVYIQQQEINRLKESERLNLVQEAKAKARVKRTKRAPVVGAVYSGHG